MLWSGLFVSGWAAGCAVKLALAGDYAFAFLQAVMSGWVLYLARRHHQ